MPSLPSDAPLATFDFLSDFLPAVDFGFGEGFRFDQPFHFDDFGGARDGSPSFGAYDDAAVVASSTILITTDKGKAFCCRVGTGVFSGLA